MIKAVLGSVRLETLTFVGLLGGLALLLVAYFAQDLRLVAIPGLALLFPSLIYGMR